MRNKEGQRLPVQWQKTVFLCNWSARIFCATGFSRLEIHSSEYRLPLTSIFRSTEDSDRQYEPAESRSLQRCRLASKTDKTGAECAVGKSVHLTIIEIEFAVLAAIQPASA